MGRPCDDAPDGSQTWLSLSIVGVYMSRSLTEGLPRRVFAVQQLTFLQLTPADSVFRYGYTSVVNTQLGNGTRETRPPQGLSTCAAFSRCFYDVSGLSISTRNVARSGLEIRRLKMIRPGNSLLTPCMMKSKC